MYQTILYKIDDKPYCCWELDVKKRNVEFLNNIDYEYFLFQSEIYLDELNGENKYKAALAIRNIYHHTIETFFSLVCATLQAPSCVYAWLYHAKVGEIRSVIRKINNHDNNLYNVLELEEMNWKSIAYKIYFANKVNAINYELNCKIADQFAELWKNLATRFLDDYSIKEYNAIKHGFRTSSGGYQLNIGPKGTLDKPERHGEWISLGASEFGSSFYVIEQFKFTNMKSNPNYQSKKYFLNWDPKLLIDVIKLLAISINNITTYLKIINRSVPENTPYLSPETDEFYNNFWKSYYNSSKMSFDIIIKPEQIEPFTVEEINKILSESKKESS